MMLQQRYLSHRLQEGDRSAPSRLKFVNARIYSHFQEN